MSKGYPPVTFQGRYLGLVALVVVQVLVGFIHVVFGLWMLSASSLEVFGIVSSGHLAAYIYSMYTIVFGFLSLVFSAGLWLERRWGWVGTVALLAFVVIADSLMLLDLPSVPGIPKFAGYGEITYSIIVLIYLWQNHIRVKYRI